MPIHLIKIGHIFNRNLSSWPIGNTQNRPYGLLKAILNPDFVRFDETLIQDRRLFETLRLLHSAVPTIWNAPFPLWVPKFSLCVNIFHCVKHGCIQFLQWCLLLPGAYSRPALIKALPFLNRQLFRPARFRRPALIQVCIVNGECCLSLFCRVVSHRMTSSK